MAELTNLIGTKWRCKHNNGVYAVIDQTEHPAGLPGLLQNDMLTLQAESATRPHPVSVQMFITIRVGAFSELFSKYRDPQPLDGVVIDIPKELGDADNPGIDAINKDSAGWKDAINDILPGSV